MWRSDGLLYRRAFRKRNRWKIRSAKKYQVNNAVKTRRLSNGHSFREKGRNCLSKHNAKQKADAIDHIKARLESLGFEYISGYEKVRYRCKLCGNVQEHCRDHVRDGNIVCHKCEHEKALIRQTEQKILKRKESERRRKEKEAERIRKIRLAFLHIISKEKRSLMRFLFVKYAVKNTRLGNTWRL